MTGKITILNQSEKITEIQIEGIIGVPEHAQFDDPHERIATYEKFQHTVQEIAGIKTKTLIVNIRSTGGNVNDALLIYDTLTALDAQIITRCYGYTASAATIIAQAASKGKREISKNALYLIHQSSSAAEGNAGELAQTIDLLGKTDERIAAIYAAASGNDAKKYAGLMRENNGNGKWLSAEEALREGLADKIIAPAKITNEIKESVRQMNLPEIPGTLISETEKKAMKLKKQWNTLLEALKMDVNENPTDETGTDILESRQKKRIEALTELEEEIEQYGGPAGNDTARKITDLQNRIVELEALNAKLRAKATQTLPKEDPSAGEIKRAGNAAAYENDMKNLLHF